MFFKAWLVIFKIIFFFNIIISSVTSILFFFLAADKKWTFFIYNIKFKYYLRRCVTFASATAKACNAENGYWKSSV